LRIRSPARNRCVAFSSLFFLPPLINLHDFLRVVAERNCLPTHLCPARGIFDYWELPFSLPPGRQKGRCSRPHWQGSPWLKCFFYLCKVFATGGKALFNFCFFAFAFVFERLLCHPLRRLPVLFSCLSACRFSKKNKIHK